MYQEHLKQNKNKTKEPLSSQSCYSCWELEFKTSKHLLLSNEDLIVHKEYCFREWTENVAYIKWSQNTYVRIILRGSTSEKYIFYSGGYGGLYLQLHYLNGWRRMLMMNLKPVSVTGSAFITVDNKSMLIR